MSDLSIDIGSEFVDVAISSTAGRRICKTPIGARKSIEAAMAAIDAAVADRALSLAQLDTIRIASTEPVNALLARNGARIALLMTQGFGDTLWLGRQNRADLYDPVARSPAPTFLVERENVFEIAGRIDAASKEIAPLDEAAIRAAAGEMRTQGIEAVAVCLLFAHVNPRHEQRCRTLIREIVPEIEICLSYEVDSQPREYERTVSVCLEAWLRPMMTHSIASLEGELRKHGFAGKLLFADSRGDLLNTETARSSVSRLVASGPAAMARCAAMTAATSKAPAAIALDIGSTSTDICLIDKGEPLTCHNTTYAGVPMRQRMLDVTSIDLGGTSRVMRENGSIGFVAARRAQKQGTTLSDALLAAGRIAGDGAHDAGVKRAAAEEIVEAAERKIAAGILNYAVKRNVDPAMTTLIAMGGLGGVLGPGVAALLGIARVVCPFAPAAGGALGLLAARSRFEASAAINAWTDEIAAGELQKVLQMLSGIAGEQAGGTATAARTTVEIAPNPHMHPHYILLDRLPEHADEIVAAFQTQHLERFGVLPPERAFVFSLTVDLSAEAGAAAAGVASALPVPNVRHAEPLLFETAAGAIWKPRGWSLASKGDCYVLQPEHGR